MVADVGVVPLAVDRRSHWPDADAVGCLVKCLHVKKSASLRWGLSSRFYNHVLVFIFFFATGCGMFYRVVNSIVPNVFKLLDFRESSGIDPSGPKGIYVVKF